MKASRKQELRREILAFLETIRRPDAEDVSFSDEGSFVEAGLIDSLAILEIVAHLEEQYGVDFGDRGVNPEELSSVKSILAVIDRSGS